MKSGLVGKAGRRRAAWPNPRGTVMLKINRNGLYTDPFRYKDMNKG